MKNDFEVLKSHYLSTFEVAHKLTGIIIGLVNILERGSKDAFTGGIPKSAMDFEKLPNAKKAQCLTSSNIPIVGKKWPEYFNRKLRNAIGHSSVHHDLRSGRLVLDSNTSIPYSEFVYSNFKLIVMLLYCHHVVKMIYVIDSMDSEES